MDKMVHRENTHNIMKLLCGFPSQKFCSQIEQKTRMNIRIFPNQNSTNPRDCIMDFQICFFLPRLLTPRPSTPMGLFRTGAFSGLDEAERAKDQATHVEGQDPEERGLILVDNTEGSVQPSWVSNHKMCSTLCNRKMTVV